MLYLGWYSSALMDGKERNIERKEISISPHLSQCVFRFIALQKVGGEIFKWIFLFVLVIFLLHFFNYI